MNIKTSHNKSQVRGSNFGKQSLEQSEIDNFITTKITKSEETKKSLNEIPLTHRKVSKYEAEMADLRDVYPDASEEELNELYHGAYDNPMDCMYEMKPVKIVDGLPSLEQDDFDAIKDEMEEHFPGITEEEINDILQAENDLMNPENISKDFKLNKQDLAVSLREMQELFPEMISELGKKSLDAIARELMRYFPEMTQEDFEYLITLILPEITQEEIGKIDIELNQFMDETKLVGQDDKTFLFNEIERDEKKRFHLFREIYTKHYKSCFTTLNQEAKIPSWKVGFERANNPFSESELKINEIEAGKNQSTEPNEIAEKEVRKFTEKERQDLIFQTYLRTFGEIEIAEKGVIEYDKEVFTEAVRRDLISQIYLMTFGETEN